MIKRLPEDLINKIAAGEVVEHPAAIVKELVENSLDAGATRIEIILEQAGSKLIAIKDNGCGIPEKQIPQALERHATSKIEDVNDLYNISTFGFRGEALASIAAVSKFTLYSRVEGEDGVKYTLENGVEPYQGNVGVTIEVHELFYNVPARKKYLRNEISEYREILRVVESFCLAYPEVAFQVQHNGAITYHKPPLCSLQENVEYVLKQDTLQEVKHTLHGIGIHAYLSTPGALHGYKKGFIFINKRSVKSRILEKALYDAYGHLLMGKHVHYVIMVDIDNEIIDVNVHPRKLEVKFEHEQSVYEAMFAAVKQLIQEYEKERLSALKEYTAPKRTQALFESTHQKSLHEEYTEQSSVIEEVISNENNTSTEDESRIDVEKVSNKQWITEYRIIGQLQKRYILIETEKGLVMFDQIHIQQQYYYEQLVRNTQGESQSLVQPYVFPITSEEKAHIIQKSNALKCIGFLWKIHENDQVEIMQVPVVCGKIIGPETFMELVESDHSIDQASTQEILFKHVVSMILPYLGAEEEELTLQGCQQYLELFNCLEDPHHCFSGKQIFTTLTKKDIEKLFR